MELKVLKDRACSTFSTLYLNPFNGIERRGVHVLGSARGLTQNPFNGIERKVRLFEFVKWN